VTRSFHISAALLAAALSLFISTGSASAQSCTDATLNGACVLQLVSAPTT
jgi:hypothetical protein